MLEHDVHDVRADVLEVEPDDLALPAFARPIRVVKERGKERAPRAEDDRVARHLAVLELEHEVCCVRVGGLQRGRERRRGRGLDVKEERLGEEWKGEGDGERLQLGFRARDVERKWRRVASAQG